MITYRFHACNVTYLFPPCLEMSKPNLNCMELSGSTLVPGYVMLMMPNKTETAVHGHCSCDMAVRMRKVLAIPRNCVVTHVVNGFFEMSPTIFGHFAIFCRTNKPKCVWGGGRRGGSTPL